MARPSDYTQELEEKVMMEERKLDSIQPYHKNAKKHPQKQVEQVAASIQEFGFNQPIVIDKDGVIIVGHGRYEAAKALKLLTVPVIEVDLTEEQANAYRLADNKLNESEWDMNLVIEELKGLTEPYLELTGFDKDLIIEPEEQDDVVPEVPVEPVSKLGDLYILGNHRVLCGDSTKIEDVERLMDGKKADMVFTDPPYGMNLDTDYSQLSNDNFGVESKSYSKVIGDDQDFNMNAFSYLDCKEQFWWGADWYRKSLPEGGSWFVWDKRVDENLDNMYGSAFELCWSKQRHQRLFIRHKFAGFFGSADARNRVHPTQKALGVCEWFLSKYSDKESIILDLFLGSGSTLIAAEKTGRICYGMELDPKYVDVIVRRWEEYTGKKAQLIS